MIDFWNTNQNPITMFKRETANRYSVNKASSPKKDLTHVSNDLSIDNDYITAKEAMETLGIGAKKIKYHILNQGIEFESFMSRGITYYKRCNIVNIEIVIPANFEIPDEYISSKDLREHLVITTMTLFTLANKNGWIKKKFKGNVSYFLKSQVLKQC